MENYDYVGLEQCLQNQILCLEEKESDDASQFIGGIVLEILKNAFQLADDDEETPCADSLEDIDLIKRDTKEKAVPHVENLMKTWNEMPELKDWQYTIEFIDETAGTSIDFCAFEVRWSKVIEGITFPKITANLYTFLKINSRNTEDPVEIEYVFEGDRFVRNSNSYFNPEWVHNAFSNKESVLETINF